MNGSRDALICRAPLVMRPDQLFFLYNFLVLSHFLQASGGMKMGMMKTIFTVTNVAVASFCLPSDAVSDTVSDRDVLLLAFAQQSIEVPIAVLETFGAISGDQTYEVEGSFDEDSFTQTISGGNDANQIRITYNATLAPLDTGLLAYDFSSSGLVGEVEWQSSGQTRLESIAGGVFSGSFNETGAFNPEFVIKATFFAVSIISDAFLRNDVEFAIERAVFRYEYVTKFLRSPPGTGSVGSTEGLIRRSIKQSSGGLTTRETGLSGRRSISTVGHAIPLPGSAYLFISAFVGLAVFSRRVTR